MKDALFPQFRFAMLFDPETARAAVERAAQWNLPRRICSPLNCYVRSRVSPDVAAYDDAVELAPIPEEELREDPPSAASTEVDALDHDPDFDDTDDL